MGSVSGRRIVRVSGLQSAILIGDPVELLRQNSCQTRGIAAPVRPQSLLRGDEELIVRRLYLSVRIRARFTAGQEVVATSDDGYRARNEEPPRDVSYMVLH
jgi:hypothetical protein